MSNITRKYTQHKTLGETEIEWHGRRWERWNRTTVKFSIARFMVDREADSRYRGALKEEDE